MIFFFSIINLFLLFSLHLISSAVLTTQTSNAISSISFEPLSIVCLSVDSDWSIQSHIPIICITTNSAAFSLTSVSVINYSIIVTVVTIAVTSVIITSVIAIIITVDDISIIIINGDKVEGDYWISMNGSPNPYG